jgi:carbon starvation protein
VLASGQLSAAQAAQTKGLVFNAQLDAVVCGVFLVLVTLILVDSIRLWVGILRGRIKVKVGEAPFVATRLRPEES